MPDTEVPHNGKRRLFNAAMVATLLGVLVSGALGVLEYLQHKRAMERDEIKTEAITVPLGSHRVLA